MTSGRNCPPTIVPMLSLKLGDRRFGLSGGGSAGGLTGDGGGGCDGGGCGGWRVDTLTIRRSVEMPRSSATAFFRPSDSSCGATAPAMFVIFTSTLTAVSVELRTVTGKEGDASNVAVNNAARGCLDLRGTVASNVVRMRASVAVRCSLRPGLSLVSLRRRFSDTTHLATVGSGHAPDSACDARASAAPDVSTYDSSISTVSDISIPVMLGALKPPAASVLLSIAWTAAKVEAARLELFIIRRMAGSVRAITMEVALETGFHGGEGGGNGSGGEGGG